jgi:hypothetical protein
MSTNTEVYTSNADFIKLYHFSEDGTLDYAALYLGIEGAEMAAEDFAGITVQGIDPVEDGWELGGFDSLEEAQEQYDCESPADLIASSTWYEGSDSSMLRYESADECSQPTVGAFTACFIGTEEA